MVTLSAALICSLATAQDTVSTRRASAGFRLRDAIEITLARSPEIAYAHLDVEAQAAALTQASAPFDPKLRVSVSPDRTRTPLFPTGPAEPTSTLASGFGYEIGIDWLLPFGLVMSPSASFRRDDMSTSPGVIRNTGTAGLSLTLPLLRDRGGAIAKASKRAASLTLEARRADLELTRALSVLNVVTAYWDYAAAHEALAVLRDAEQRAGTLVEQTRALIGADERPAIDSISVLAHEASKAAVRLNAENTVSTALQDLALVMGIRTAIPPRTEPFPPIPEAAVIAAWPSVQTWTAYALRRRPDLTAARNLHSAAQGLLRGVRSEAQSRLDLRAGIGYTGIGLGGGLAPLLGPFRSERQGVQLEAELSYERPLGNRLAEGQVHRSMAEDRRAALAVEDLERQIALAVATSSQTLRRTAEESRLAVRAVRLFSTALEGERRKYQLGTATLFDVILAEDNLTGAQLGWINAQRRYAVAVAELLHQVGAPLGESGCAAEAPAPLTPNDDVCPR